MIQADIFVTGNEITLNILEQTMILPEQGTVTPCGLIFASNLKPDISAIGIGVVYLLGKLPYDTAKGKLINHKSAVQYAEKLKLGLEQLNEMLG